MAAEIKGDPNELNIPKSTGNVKYEPPADPPGAETDNTSTGAVEYGGPLVGELTNDADENGGKAEVRVKTPTEPVVMTSGWLSEAEAKVITKKQVDDAKKSVQEPKKSAKADTPAEPKADTKKKD